MMTGLSLRSLSGSPDSSTRFDRSLIHSRLRVNPASGMKKPPPPPKPPDPPPPELTEPQDPPCRGTASMHLPLCHHLRLLLTVDNTAPSQSPDSIPAPAMTRSLSSARAHNDFSASVSLESHDSCSGLGSPAQSSSGCLRSHPHLHELTCAGMSYGFAPPISPKSAFPALIVSPPAGQVDGGGTGSEPNSQPRVPSFAPWACKSPPPPMSLISSMAEICLAAKVETIRKLATSLNQSLHPVVVNAVEPPQFYSPEKA